MGRQHVHPGGAAFCGVKQGDGRSNFEGYVLGCAIEKLPTARIVSLVRGEADDRAEAAAGGVCHTASWPHIS